MPKNRSGFSTYHLVHGLALSDPEVIEGESKGFTLIELLVVIAIIAVLSVVGIVLFTNVQKGARDSKRRVDIDSIAKAYEIKKGNSYTAIGDSDFSSGKKPQDSSKGDYFNWLAQDGSGFKACAALDSNPSSVCNTPALNCYCKFSTQENLNPSSPANFTASTNEEIGLGGSSSQSCDPNGTLLSGLVGYWKMDEGSWTGAGTVTDSSGNGNHGTAYGGANTTFGKFGNAGNFDGVSGYALVSDSNSLDALDLTIAFWMNMTALPSTYAGGNNIHVVGKSDAYWFTIDPGDKYDFRIKTFDANGYFPGAGINPGWVVGQWYQIVVTFDNTTRTGKIYRNGTLSASDTSVGNAAASTANLYLGDGQYSWAQNFNGLIDDVRVYNRALTGGFAGSEISNLYNGGNGCISQ